MYHHPDWWTLAKRVPWGGKIVKGAKNCNAFPTATRFGMIRGPIDTYFLNFVNFGPGGRVTPCGDLHQSFTDALVILWFVLYICKPLVIVRDRHNSCDSLRQIEYKIFDEIEPPWWVVVAALIASDSYINHYRPGPHAVKDQQCACSQFTARASRLSVTAEREPLSALLNVWAPERTRFFVATWSIVDLLIWHTTSRRCGARTAHSDPHQLCTLNDRQLHTKCWQNIAAAKKSTVKCW